MALRDELLDDIDEIRAIPGELGLRRYEVTVRKIVSSGSRVGKGTKTTTDTVLLVGGQPPKVKQLRAHDVIAGDAGKQFAQFEIGPLTPEFFGGGHDPSELSPQQDGQPTEVYYIVKGPGLPADGVQCQRVEDDLNQPFRYMVRVKAIGKKANP